MSSEELNNYSSELDDKITPELPASNSQNKKRGRKSTQEEIKVQTKVQKRSEKDPPSAAFLDTLHQLKMSYQNQSSLLWSGGRKKIFNIQKFDPVTLELISSDDPRELLDL